MNESFMPKYSFYPLFLAFAILLIAIGVITTLAISVLGVGLLFAAIVGWTWENRSDEQEHPNE